jgi:hypothetical protein
LNAGSTSQRREPAESLRQSRRRQLPSVQRPGRHVEQQQVHRSVLEKHRRHRQRFFQRIRRQNHEPVQLDAPGLGLHRVETFGQIQIRRDPAGGLGLRHGLKRQGRGTAGAIAVQRGGRGARQPAQT